MSEDTDDTAKHVPGTFSKVLKVLAYPIAALTGGAFWHTHVRKSSLERINNMGTQPGGAFADLVATRKAAHDALLAKPINPETFPHELKTINQAFSQGQATRMEKMGFSTMLSRYKSLSRYTRFETALTAFTAAGISLGVLLTIADSKFLLNKINASDQDKSL